MRCGGRNRGALRFDVPLLVAPAVEAIADVVDDLFRIIVRAGSTHFKEEASKRVIQFVAGDALSRHHFDNVI
jgi:hypothetical protein